MKVDRESISQKATDFSSLTAKAGNAKVVFVPFQLSSQAQLFAQQLKAQGSNAIVFGSDGTFDSSKFNVSGSYISFFAPDVTTLDSAKATVAAFKKQFPGGTSPFGAPNYVLAQMYATAISNICKKGDKPTVGLLLCRSKNNVVAEYALRGYRVPLGVSEWVTAANESLPEEVASVLPSVAELEAELAAGPEQL